MFVDDSQIALQMYHTHILGTRHVKPLPVCVCVCLVLGSCAVAEYV